MRALSPGSHPRLSGNTNLIKGIMALSRSENTNRYSQFALRYQSDDCYQSGLFTDNKNPFSTSFYGPCFDRRVLGVYTAPPPPTAHLQLSVLIKMIGEFQILFFFPSPTDLSEMLIKQASLNHISLLLHWILLRGHKA